MAVSPILMILLGVVGIVLGVFLLVYLIVPIFKGIGWLIKHVFTFVFGMILDVLRFVGSVVTAIIMIPLTLGNVVLGRWSGASHYGRALQSELVNCGLSVYRLLVGHPARFLLLSALTEGIEKRLPAAVAAAPGTDKPLTHGRAAQFEGYTIVGSLQAGGSGGKLYVANPDAAKRAAFERAGHRDVQQVVIKTFSLDDGSELPQIVRESRSLDAAKKLGLVLDHELSNKRFYYAMRYVPGQPLGLVTPQLHAASGGLGLDERHARVAAGYVADLLMTLETYHRGGLWHKDVKPDNIIVDGQRAHLVDFGLVTPLRSSMTLTTHGTEYFRDPELVRLALKGVKVSEVDGARFDVYAAGAVLYSMFENSFPAHGVLSQISRRCPEVVKWIVRRAMADYDKRYPTSAAMLLDVQAVIGAPDPFALKPIDLPSMNGQVPFSPRPVDEAVYRPAYAPMADAAGAAAASPVPPGVANPVAGATSAASPKITVKNWWTGQFDISREEAASPNAADGAGFTPASAGQAAPFVQAAGVQPPLPPLPLQPAPPRRPAAEQLASARARADAARQRIQTRMAGRRAKAGKTRVFSTEPNVGVFIALFVFLGICLLIVGGIVSYAMRNQQRGLGPVSELNTDWETGFATMTVPTPPPPPEAPEPPTAAEADFTEDAARSGTIIEFGSPGAGTVSFNTKDPASIAAAMKAMKESLHADSARLHRQRIAVKEQHESQVNAAAEAVVSDWNRKNSPPAATVNDEPVGVFVWLDIARPIAPEIERTIAEIIERFDRHGFLVSGELPGVELDEEERQDLLNQTADLVTAASVFPWDSEEMRAAVARWAGTQEGVDLVLRFGVGGVSGTIGREDSTTPSSHIQCALVAREDADESTRNELRGAFVSAQRVLQNKPAR